LHFVAGPVIDLGSPCTDDCRFARNRARPSPPQMLTGDPGDAHQRCAADNGWM